MILLPNYYPLSTLTSSSPFPFPSYATAIPRIITPLPSKVLRRPSFLGAARTPPPVRLSLLCSSTSSSSSSFSFAASARSDTESSLGQNLYPLHHCKTIHLVRHAQAVHNVEGEKDYAAYSSEEHFDAPLSPLGWQQVDNLRKHAKSCGISKNIELVIVSPLLRAMQTAIGAFGGRGYTDGIDAPSLMVENAGNSSHPAISSLNCPPFIAVELCRERLGVHPCDRRRSISEYKPLFPAIDFSLIESDPDILWKPDSREKKEELAARGMKFLNWLWTRREKEIAVVTHNGFLIQTLSAFGNDCHPVIQNEIRSPFKNCELRSVVIVDRSMMGSDSSTTNYPGNIPSGAVLPSDAAKEKHPGVEVPK